MSRAIVYARVSTDEQADKGYSLPSQIEACKRYAERIGATVVAEHQDDYSGASLHRPEFDKALDMIRAGACDAFITLSSDRLTRNLSHLLYIRDLFNAQGVELHYVRKGKVDDSPESHMMENIEGAFNEYWRLKIAEATSRGMREKAKRGRVVGIGGAPFGYDFADGQLVRNEDEAFLVHRIFTWYAGDGLNGQRLTAWQIAREFSAAKIPTPGERNIRRRKRDAGVWNGSTILRILSDETYIGVWRYGKRIGKEGRGGARAEAETVAVSVPAIIDVSLFRAAQMRREENKRFGRYTQREYPLRGIVKCSCGRRMSGTTKNAGKSWERAYYICPRKDQAFAPAIEPRKCTQNGIRAEVLERIVWDYLIDITTDVEKFEQGIQDALKRQAKETPKKHKRAAELDKALARLDSEAAGLIDEKRGAKPGGLIAKKLQARIDEAERLYAEYSAERAALAVDLAAQDYSASELQAAREFRDKVVRGLKIAAFADEADLDEQGRAGLRKKRRDMLEALRVEVEVVEAGDVEISCIIPMAKRKVPLCTSTSNPRHSPDDDPRFLRLARVYDLAAEFAQAAQKPVSADKR